MSTFKRIRRGMLAPLVMTVAAALATAGPVSAGTGDPYYGPHSGNRGLHTLIDNQSEFQGVTCVYASDFKLGKVVIRRPIVFAYDRTAKVDHEWVAWRFVVEYSEVPPSGGGYVDWPNFSVSSWVKAKATDRLDASWSPRSFQFGSNVGDHMLYRVTIQMRWYSPYPSKTNVDGSATDVVQWYRQTQPNEPDMVNEGFCPSGL